jgi:dolichol-phosphate mannosyltransferase
MTSVLAALGKAPQRTLKVSIIIPVYNESLHVEDVISRVLEAPLSPGLAKEIIVVDDGSTDGTSDILEKLEGPFVKVHRSKLNSGKGSAIRAGLKHATGDIVVIQDGDREYNPEDIDRVIAPIVRREARVSYGSRFLGQIDGMYFKYWMVNKLLVLAVLILYQTRITDEATAYKAFDKELIDQIPLRCRRFEFCPEITAKVLRRGEKIAEVPITYFARTVEQGKKIRFLDAIDAFWTLLRYRF